MTTRTKTPITSWVLGLLTAAALLANRPLTLEQDLLGLALVFAALIALTHNLGVLLNPAGDINPAHLFSIMAFLALSKSDQIGAALWLTAAGTLVGGLIQAARSDQWLPRRQVTIRSVTTAIEATAHLTLTLLVGAAVYLEAGGRLPLGYLQPADVMPLVIFSTGYSLVYLLFFTLRIRLDNQVLSRVLFEDWPTVLGVILLPIPFGILGAVVYNDLDQLSWAILVGVLFLLVSGVFAMGQMRYYSLQQVRELSSISAISQAMRSNLELNDLLETIYEQASGLLGLNNFTVALLDPRQAIIRFPLAVRQGQRENLPARAPSNTLLDTVIAQRAPLLIEREVHAAASALGSIPPDGPVYAWLGVPLIASDRVLGGISIYSSDPDRLLSSDDQQVLMNIATQASVALENAQLYGQAQERAHQLSTLNNISTLLTGTLSPERVLNLVASSMAALADSDAVAVYLYRGSTPHLARNVGLSPAFSQQPPAPLIAAAFDPAEPGRAAQLPVTVSDLRADPRPGAALRAAMQAENVHAWVEFLLLSGDRPAGIISALYRHPRAFSAEELELLRTFTVQAALALHNAELYTTTDVALERRMNQLQALYDIGQELNASLNLQRILDRVLSYAIESTPASAGLVVTSQENGSGISIAAHQGYSPGAVQDSLLQGSITAEAYHSGRPIVVSDVRAHSHYRLLNPETRSQFSIPILRDAETLGVITLEAAGEHAFGEDDIIFATQLATQAAIAMENARLFKQVAEGRDQLQVIVDNMSEAILLINRDGQIGLANPPVFSLLGVRPERLLGRSIAQALAEDGAPLAEAMGFTSAALNSLLDHLQRGQWDARAGASATYAIGGPEPVYINRYTAPVKDEQEAVAGLLLVFLDQTEEQELAQAREALSQMIVHDLRSPLTAVTTSLKLLHDLAPAESDFTPIVRRTTEASSRAVRKLLNLVDSLLDIARMESGRMRLDREPVHLAAVTSSILDEMHTLADELEVTLRAQIPEDLPLLDVDRDQIERVLLNLVDNALKFTPADGVVTVRGCRADDSTTPAGFIRIDVSDTGPGVPDEYKTRLFDRFAQMEGAHGRRRGTGLGLTYCRLTIEAHGGTIWIEDNPAGGAVFAFTLPVADVPPEA